MELNLIPKEYKDSSDYSSSLKSVSNEGKVSAHVGAFSIKPEELTQIVNKYKERDENMQDINYFIENNGIDSLLNAIATDKTNGISSENGREEHFGSNKVFKKPPPTFCEFVLEALADKMIIILICCSIFEIGISLFYIFGKGDKNNMEWVDGTSIIFAILVVVLVGSVTNYQKETKFQDLNRMQNESTKYNVIRNGIPRKLIADQILVGDLIKINYGDILPADLLMIEGNGVKIDESSLTGESNAVSKKPFEKCREELEGGSRNPSSMILLSGTNVIEGAGTAVAIAVGSHSQKGIIRGTIDNAQEDNKTPLEIKLDKIANLIGYFGLGSAIVTLIALVIRLIITYSTGKETFSFSSLIKNVLTIVILCVSIIVVAIPEGLPLAVTLSLAFSIKRLMKANNLVRKMHACETMGGATVICTDKTGTLTLNLMFVTRIITFNERKEIKSTMDNVENAPKNVNTKKRIRDDHTNLFQNEDYWDVLYSAIALNVDCTINKLSQPDVNGDLENFDTKNKTDQGFIEFLYQYKSPVSAKKELYLSSPENYKISPFDSKKKRMSTYVRNEQFPSGYRLFTKGGAENAMLYCNRYIDSNTGKVNEINEEIKNFVNNEIEIMNKKMIRTLYLCYRDITEQQFENDEEIDGDGLLIDQKNLIFIGIFGLRDTLRGGVKNSVDQCHNAGVRVIMVTGDNLITATAIAKDCEIFPEKIDLDNLRIRDVETNPNETNDPEKKDEHIKQLLEIKPYAMTGNSFYQSIGGLICKACGQDTGLCKCAKSEAEAEEIAKHNGGKRPPIKVDEIRNMDNFIKISTNLLVMARSQPLHKYALVLGLKALGNVVAVTGDGTNDAPALSKSDVGFSMNDGTDIAKEASDIILMDNNFSSIVIAMIYGRSIYENLRKFLQFQLTVNFCACILVFICSCIGNETPLASIQMLWVNLIMDSLGSLALATEPPYEELLNRKPTNKTESIINGRMWKHIVFQALFELIILVCLYLYAPVFVPEHGKEMKESADLLIKCFGEMPGGFKNNNGKIIYGNADKWSDDAKFNFAEYNTQEKGEEAGCARFLPNFDEWNKASLFEAHDYYLNYYGGTSHMTLVFDIFVIYTLFNQINCRIIDDSFNTFKRIGKSYMFIGVTIIELGIQILLSQVGYKIFHCVHNGLGFVQWGICFAFSISTMLFNFLIKLIPLEKVIDPWTKGPEQRTAEKARTTINLMVNQNLKD